MFSLSIGGSITCFLSHPRNVKERPGLERAGTSNCTAVCLSICGSMRRDSALMEGTGKLFRANDLPLNMEYNL